jgi:hypothetical protein
LAISLGEFMLNKGDELGAEVVELFHFFIEDFDHKISDSSFTYFANFVSTRISGAFRNVIYNLIVEL